MPDKELYAFAQECRAITKKHRILLIINERFDIARLIGADGVHLPQYSFPADVVKALCPTDFFIGVSTHSLDEAMQAEKEGASYITFSSQNKGSLPETRTLLLYHRCCLNPSSSFRRDESPASFFLSR